MDLEDRVQAILLLSSNTIQECLNYCEQTLGFHTTVMDLALRGASLQRTSEAQRGVCLRIFWRHYHTCKYKIRARVEACRVIIEALNQLLETYRSAL